MSADIKVFVKKNEIPTRGEWESALASIGIEAKFDSAMDNPKFNGYLPILFKGQETGFELYIDPLSDTMFSPEDDPSLAERLGERDYCVSLSAGYEMPHIEAAIYAAAALAKAKNGVIWAVMDFAEPGDPVEWARISVAELGGG